MSDRLVTRVTCSVLVGAVGFFLATVTPAENPADEHVKVELVSEKDAIVPTEQVWLGIRFDLEEGWHTYWVNPGDSGEPPRIEWQLPTGFQVGSIEWPYPARLSTPPFVDYGYEHQVLLSVPVLPPSGLNEGTTAEITARIHYLVCHDVCIPGRKQLLLSLPVKNHAAPGANLLLFEETRKRQPKATPKGWKVSAASVGGEFLLTLKTGKLPVDPQFFPLEPEQIENAAPQNVTLTPGGVQLHLKKSNHLLKPLSRIRGLMVVSGTAYWLDVPVSQSPRGVQMQFMKN
jgi:DsbC/DsbD-like thiol-disulfide interchange protein